MSLSPLPAALLAVAPSALACLLSLAGMGLVYRGWKTSHGPSSAMGWAVAVAAALAWVPAVGVEYALVYACFFPALAVWPFIARQASWIAPKARGPRPRRRPHFDGVSAAANLGKAVVVAVGLPLAAGIAAVFVGFQLPVTPSAQAATAIVLLPVFTAAFVWFYLASRRPARFLAAGTAATAALSTVMFL